MAVEINEDNDWNYLEKYFNSELIKDLRKGMNSKNVTAEDIRNIYQHIELYNKFMISFTKDIELLNSENELLKKALIFNTKIIEKLQEQSNQNAIGIEKMKMRGL